jgi:hypothetical protein
MSEKRRLTARLKVSEAESRAFSLGVQRFVERQLRTLVEAEKIGTLAPEDAARVLGSLFEDLQRRGLKGEIAKIRSLYADEISFVEETLARAAKVAPEGGIFTDIDKSTIDAIVNVEEQKMLMNTGASVSEIQSALMRTALAGEPLNIGALMSDRMDALQSRMETLANTGLAGFQRTVILAKGQDLGFDLFIYLGPDDGITRPFCEKLLHTSPPIFSIKQIEKMNNGQNLPAMQYGGGYNCRHQWRPISGEEAAAQGFKG